MVLYLIHYDLLVRHVIVPSLFIFIPIFCKRRHTVFSGLATNQGRGAPGP